MRRSSLSEYDADEAKIAAYSWEGLLGAIEALCYQLLIPQMGEERLKEVQGLQSPGAAV